MVGGKWIPEIDSTLKNKKKWANNYIRSYFDCVEMPPRNLQTQSFFEKSGFLKKI